MNRLWETAWVIARRDFTATVMSRSFLLFLISPLVLLAFVTAVGEFSKQTDRAASQPTIAVISDTSTAEAIREAREAVAGALGAFAVPDFRTVEPETDVPAQIRRLLASDEDKVSAVLSGDLSKPKLTAPRQTLDALGGPTALIVDAARQRIAIEDAGASVPTEGVEMAVSGPSAGSLSRFRAGLARGGQILILALTLFLAGIMLSAMVEEKSNKIIEVLTAAAPIDAVFLGKLLGMLGVSIVAIGVWGSIAGMGMFLLQSAFGGMISPAVGWPAYVLLVLAYFATNFLILGAVFLVIGGQATSIRDVQTRSMPATFAQMALFALAGSVVNSASPAAYWAAVVFPLSSPLAMVAIAAQSKALWPHLLAILWQLAWTALIIRVSARMFRRTVLKSGKSDEPLFRLRKARS